MDFVFICIQCSHSLLKKKNIFKNNHFIIKIIKVTLNKIDKILQCENLKFALNNQHIKAKLYPKLEGKLKFSKNH